MRQKPGLHKKLSSIFDGIPIPQTNRQQVPETEPNQPADTARGSGPAQTHQPQPTVPGHQKPAPTKPNIPSPSPANRPATATKPAQVNKPVLKPDKNSSYTPKPAPAKPKVQPSPKPTTTLSKQQSPLLSKVKDFLDSLQDGTEQARQRKMAVLIGLLSVVLVCVFFFVLYEPKKGHANPVSDTVALNSDQTQTWKTNWTVPEIYPDTLRDPMRYNPTATADPTITQIGQLVIKGIVFSKDKPSAIISGSIVSEGQKILGVTVIKINKESVEFEKDGKTWTQPIQR